MGHLSTFYEQANSTLILNWWMVAEFVAAISLTRHFSSLFHSVKPTVHRSASPSSCRMSAEVSQPNDAACGASGNVRSPRA